MLPLILLSLTATLIEAEDCPYMFAGEHYKRTFLISVQGIPSNLAYNPSTDELLFTLIDSESLADVCRDTKMDQYVLKNKDLIKIETGGQSAAVDVKNNNSYIGTENGLNIFKDRQSTFVAFECEDIVYLHKPQHTNAFYAIVHPDNNLYRINVETKIKEDFQHIPYANMVAVDSCTNIYYEYDCVMVLLAGYQVPIQYVGLERDKAKAMAVDTSDRVILAMNDGLYYLRPNNVIPEKIMDTEFKPSGLLFDKNDIYMATNNLIYKYTKCETGTT